MAVSTKDQERLNGAQQSAVQNYTDQYYEAKARGDKAGMRRSASAIRPAIPAGQMGALALRRRARQRKWNGTCSSSTM